MLRFPVSPILFSLILLAAAAAGSHAAIPSPDNRKTIRIEGLRIFKSEELKKILDLEGGRYGIPEKEIIRRITDFYKKNGYSIVKVHVAENTPEKLTLYVNEGRLGKIIVHDLNNYYSLKVKQVINYPGRIYNEEITEQNISEIKKKFRFRNVRAELGRVADFSDSLFQIDRELKKITVSGN